MPVEKEATLSVEWELMQLPGAQLQVGDQGGYLLVNSPDGREDLVLGLVPGRYHAKRYVESAKELGADITLQGVRVITPEAGFMAVGGDVSTMARSGANPAWEPSRERIMERQAEALVAKVLKRRKEEEDLQERKRKHLRERAAAKPPTSKDDQDETETDLEEETLEEPPEQDAEA